MKTTLDQVMQMTDEEVRIALAKFAGFKDISLQPFGDPESGVGFYDWASGIPGKGGVSLPNYPSSLDALQPIKEGLTYEQKVKFAKNIYTIHKSCFIYDCDGPVWDDIATMFSTPASQQSRALLAAMGE